MRFIFSSFSSLLLLGLVAAACGGGDGSSVNGGNGDGKGASSSGGSLMLDPNGNGNGIGASNGSGTISPDDACAKGQASAALKDVNMIVMFDRSTSMHDAAGDSGATRWELASAALDAFFASDNAAGLKLALRFFPHDMPAAGCNQQECSTEACAEALVNLATLTAEKAPADAHEAALLAATAGATPAPRNQGGGMGMMSGGTPISAALSGATAWAAAQHTKTPNENTVVVLVTDGEPNGCEENIGAIAQIAADAFRQDDTRTYAIGLTGSQEDDMDEIAMSGNTGQGIFVADGANTTQDLLDALGAIRGAILDCDFPMPEATGDLVVNPGLINVNYTPSSGTPATLVQVSGEPSCAGAEGWYYDDIVNPSRIILCKSTCDAVTSDPMAKLDILLGCETSTSVPK